MRKILKVSVAFLLPVYSFFLAWMSFGVSSESWEQKGYLEFSKGTLDKVSITGEGHIVLSPPFEKIAEVPEKVIWMLAEDENGEVYTATGNEGKVYKISKEGTVEVFFDSEEIEVHSIIFDQRYVMYAATSPDGKVYKLDKGGETSIFYDPEDKYIWAMAFGKDETLYVATGEEGNIYAISKEGEAQLFYNSSVEHIRALAFHEDGNLIAGTAGEGLIMSIGQDGKAFVLFDSLRQEISSLTISKEGTIYAAAVGGKIIRKEREREKASDFHIDMSAAINQTKEVASKVMEKVKISIPEEGKEEKITTAGSEIFKIEKSGFPRKIWESQNEVIHCLLIDEDGNLLVGTGDEGIIYKIDQDEEASVLIKTDDHQITHMIPSDEKILIGSGSNSTLSFMGKDFSPEGEYLSQVKDTDSFSTWGMFKSEFVIPLGTKLSFYTRSGNKELPDETWSPWEEITMKKGSSHIDSPTARFIQWKVKLEWSERAKDSPALKSSTINYLPENSPPEIITIEIQEPGIFFQKLPIPQISGTELPGTTNRNKTKAEKSVTPLKMRPPIKKVYQYGKRTVNWEASDPNGDDLVFSIEFKGLKERIWKSLEKDLMENFYSWDSRLLADGQYVIRILASDSPSNPDHFAKQAAKTSEPFIIDNTPPSISPIKWSHEGNKIKISFLVNDNTSSVDNVEYSLNAGDWKMIFPDDRVYDSLEESFHMELSLEGKGEYTLVVKAMDEAGNIGSGKAIMTY